MKTIERAGKVFVKDQEFEMLDDYYLEMFHLLMRKYADYIKLNVDDRKVLAWTAHRRPNALDSLIDFFVHDYQARSISIEKIKLCRQAKETIARLHRFENE